MEDTQVINWDLEEEEETEEPSEPLGHSLEPVGRLRFFSSPQAPEKDFPLYLGKNVVGRMPDCAVALPFSSISKQHAVIEILACDKAPILRDCGSLNGTQILRPPKVLKHGMSHRLRDQELILFGDLPCQYYRLAIPKPFVCRGPLTVEQTPRVQGAQPQELLLAEDSEEEVDPTFEEPKTTSSPLTTVVPESDEEGGLPAPDGPGPPFVFNLDSDTDEEIKPPVSGGDSFIARRDAIAETEPKTDGTAAESQIAKDPCAVKKKNHDSKAESDPGGEKSQAADEDSDTDVDDKSISTGRLAGDHLEMIRSSGFMDSDTDVEEEGIPATPAVAPLKQRLVIYGVGTNSSGAPDLTHRQENPSDSDTDVEESKAPLPAPLERSLGSMEIDNEKDDKEEISVAPPLVSLKEETKESLAIKCSGSPDTEGSSAQPVGLLEQNQTSTRRGSHTDMEEKGIPVKKKGRTVSKGHPDKAHPEKHQSPLGDSDRKVDISSAGVQLEGNQASATEVISKQVEKKYQVPVVWTNQRNVEAEEDPRKLPGVHPETSQSTASVCGAHAEKGTSLVSSAVADVSKSHLGTECAVVLLEPKKELETEAQGGSPVVQVKEDSCPISGENPTDLVVDKGIPWEKPTQPLREEAQSPLEKEKHQAHRIKDSGDSHDDSEDLDLQATQCFVKVETQSVEEQSMEDEATQAYLLPHEPGPSCCSMPAQGALDESWEVLATQPFCSRESETPESQPATAFPEDTGSCLSLPGVAPQDQHPESPVPKQPWEIEDRGMQTVEEDLGRFSCQIPPSEETSRDDQESPDISLPSAVPESSASQQKPLILHNQKHSAPQTVLALPSPLECPIPRTRQKRSQKAPMTPLSSEPKKIHTKPNVKTQESPRMTPPVSSLALEPHNITPRDQPVSSETTSRVTRGRARRSSVKTPELGVPTAPELQPSASTEQRIIPKRTSQATGSRTLRSSVKTPEAGIATASELQSSHTIDQSVTSESTTRTTWGRTRRSSVKTPEPVVLTTPELQPSACENQPVTPELTVRVTRSKGHGSSDKTLESVVPPAPEHQLYTPTDQAVTPEPTSWTTRGRTSKSLKTSIPFVPVAPENRPSTPTVVPEPVIHTTRGRTRSSAGKTPEPVPPATRIQPTVVIDQLVPLEIAQGRTRRSIKTPKSASPPNPELQPSTSTDQPVIPEPLSQTTQGTSVKTSQLPEPTFLGLEHIPTDQSVIPETKAQDGQGKRLRSSVSAATSESQSPAPNPTPQANCGRKARANRKHGSLAVTIVHEVSSVPPEPVPQSSRSQKRAVKTAKSLQTKPEPVSPQPPETPTHVPEVQKIEATQRSGHSPETRPKATQSQKRPLVIVDSSPLPKRLQRGEVPQKITFLKEEEEDTAEKPGKEEDVVVPEASKRKRAQAEEEPEGRAKRSLRRTKSNPDSTAPKVLFTGVVDERGKRALLDLGGSLANSVAEASYLVTDRIRRTVKFLCALGRGIPILSLDWLYQSHKARRFLPPDDYVVMDPEHEKNFGFSLKESLSRAQERRLLEGYEIHVTPGVQPPPAEMGEIISCCGGTLLTSMPRAYKPQRVVITCSQDFHRCSVPLRVGLPILSPEFLLTGVLKQEVKPEAFIFSALEKAST
ncbi:mediator of DNA damage checkpoint protein 1 isoform X2 [Sorex fumeus]|uniref:mediator of DNA damage checkpoint protein 1 isoform X2 n=1 Tax=Sorex fumeus TaxID=62283 RepID=UPI0024AE55D1|nr:mediator of DNA damage checkpoint protein 1 isoform X2 [Sorex fumeus]